MPGTKNSKVKEKDGLWSTRIRVDDFILFLVVSMISIVNTKSLLLHDAAIVETWYLGTLPQRIFEPSNKVVPSLGPTDSGNTRRMRMRNMQFAMHVS